MSLQGKAHYVLAAGLVAAVVAGYVLGRPEEPPAGGYATRLPSSAPGTTPAAPPSAPPAPRNPDLAAAAEAIASGDLERARTLLEKVPPGDPEHGTALHNLGVLYGELGAKEAAVEAFRRLVELDPGSAEAWVGLGWALYRTGEHAEAERATLRAIEIAPEHANARYNLALFRLADGRAAEAIEAYRRAFPADRDRTGIAGAIRDVSEYAVERADRPDAKYVLAFLFNALGEHGLEVRTLESYLLSPGGSEELREKAGRLLETARGKAIAEGLIQPIPGVDATPAPAGAASPAPTRDAAASSPSVSPSPAAGGR